MNIFQSRGTDIDDEPLTVVSSASFIDGLLSMSGRARAYEATLVLLIDDLDPVVVPVEPDGGWAVEAKAQLRSSVAVGDEDAKSGGMSALTTIHLRITEAGTVVPG